jgi:adenylate cyclase
MRQSLRRYVPGAVAEQLEAGQDLEEGEREVSVLFVDLRRYTTYSESRGTEEVFSTVNRYTDAVSRIVREHGHPKTSIRGRSDLLDVYALPMPSATRSPGISPPPHQSAARQ